MLFIWPFFFFLLPFYSFRVLGATFGLFASLCHQSMLVRSPYLCGAFMFHWRWWEHGPSVAENHTASFRTTVCRHIHCIRCSICMLWNLVGRNCHLNRTATSGVMISLTWNVRTIPKLSFSRCLSETVLTFCLTNHVAAGVGPSQGEEGGAVWNSTSLT